MHTEAELRPLLAEVADQGWAEVEQELEVGLFSLAAPVRDVDGAVVAAINVSTTGGDRRRAPDSVLAAAAAISADLASTSLR